MISSEYHNSMNNTLIHVTKIYAVPTVYQADTLQENKLWKVSRFAWRT